MAIYRRGKIWWIDYYFRGKRIREAVSESWQEAMIALKAREGDIVRGRFELKKEAGERLFEDFAIEFTEHIKTTRKWWKTEVSRMKHLVKHFGNLYLSEITPYHVDNFKAKRRKSVSGAAVNRELGLLKCMLNKAIKWGCLDSNNPASGISHYPETPKERILNDEEARALVAHCSASVRSVVVAALNTGMRRGELLELKWENVDFINRFIRVVRSKNYRQRKVPMNSVLYEELWKLRRKGCEYVFTQLDSETRLRCVRSAFERACSKAGIEALRFHDLRHTFATNLVLGGVDLVTVKEILGHSDIAMTVRYSHPSDTRKLDAVESLVPRKMSLVSKNGYKTVSHNLVTIPESGQNEGFVSH